MTKATPATAIVPDVTKEPIIAIILPKSKKVLNLNIDSMRVQKKKLQVYYHVTDTIRWTTYPQTTEAVVAVKPVRDVTEITFFRDGKKEETIHKKLKTNSYNN